MFSSMSATVSRSRLFIITTSIPVLALISVAVVFAAISLSTSTVYTQNFDGMGVPATTTTPSTLPTDFKADTLTTVRTVGVFSAAGTTTARAGGADLATNAANGIYNYGSGTATLGGSDRAVGFLASGTATTSGNVYAQMLNSTGGDLSGLQISYNVEKYRNGTNAAGFRIQMYYSTDGNTWTSAGNNFLTSFAADANNNGFATVPGSMVAVNNQTLSTTIPNGSNFYLAWNYSVSSGSTVTNAQALAIDDISILGIQGSSPTPTNPTGVGVANPSALLAGNQTLITVTVTPGSNPASTGLNASANLSSIGGSATQQFFDDGTHGDVVVGNNVFSYSATVSVATTPGAKTIPFSITDAQSRSGSGNVSLTVTPVFRDPAQHMVMGNPSGAVTDVGVPLNYLMMKPQYALSYNSDKGTSNWTSWHLDNTWTTGVADRQNDFRSDDTLPLSFKHVSDGYQFATYGFDRGHMCPSADRTSSVADNSATFLMTNMVPQASGNNQGPWASMETYIRTQLSGTVNELYIISGGTGIGGTSSTGHWDSIIDTAGNTVTVPHVTWKVVMVLPSGTSDDVARVSTSTRTFAVIMPNDDNIRSDQWQKYLATVDQVEALSSYDFYSNVPTAVQDVIEARLDAENDTPPVTSNQTVTTAKDQGVAVTLSATDFNVNNTFTYQIVAQPLHGSLSGSNGNLTYSPNPHYVGPDLFTFKANDGAKDSNVSTVTIMVNEPPSTICSVLNNGEWIIAGLDASIPEAPFEVRINGNPVCTTKLLAFADRVPDTSRFPQVFTIYSSGYIRMKAGADPSPPLPFGQSLVLGPAIFGASASFPAPTLFFRPQVQIVDIDTSQLKPDGTGTLLISVTANDSGLAPTSTNTNQIMNQTWKITLHEPTNEQTRIDVAGTFTFTETAIPDATRTAEFQSFRLLQISSMFIDSARHDVDAFRFRNAAGLVTFFYNPDCFNQLCPPTPSALDPSTAILDSLHTDDVGQPNGNTPSYRILMGTTTGPISGPITPRAIISCSQDVNDDNLGLWLHQQPWNVIPQGTSGSISYTVVATTDPTPALTPTPVVLTASQIDQLKAWTLGGRTSVYVRPKFPDAGYRIQSWGLATRTGNDFTVDATVEKFTGTSVQAVVTTAQIYDLGLLANGVYHFNFKTSGTLAKALEFTVGGTAPPPNPIDDQRRFVRQQYLDFLNREPDGPGWDFWTDNITKCSDPNRCPPSQTEAQCISRQRETTSAAFFISPEFKNTGYFVLRVYRGSLGRFPYFGGSVPTDNSKDEFTRDHATVSAGIVVNDQLDPAVINANKQAFANQFVGRAEFLAIYGALNNTDYVEKLFQTTGVPPTAAERSALIDGLTNSTETRASVLFKIVDGTLTGPDGGQQFQTRYGQAFYEQQLNRAFVQMEYFGYLRRDPDDAGYAFWLCKLNQYPSFVEAEMVLAFILSPEYRSRFGQP